MDENPYQPPPLDWMTEYKMKRRRRKVISFFLTIDLFIVLFTAYMGLKILYVVIANWLFPDS